MNLDRLIELGFDRTEQTDEGQWRVRCSACDALVINGVPCHETGCRNQAAARRAANDDFDDFED